MGWGKEEGGGGGKEHGDFYRLAKTRECFPLQRKIKWPPMPNETSSFMKMRFRAAVSIDSFVFLF